MFSFSRAKANEVLSRDPVALQMEVMKLKAQIEKMKKGGYKPDPSEATSPAPVGASCSTPEPDPEMENKIRENEERIEELEAQLEEVQSDSHRAVERNREMEEEIRTLRTLKTELQTDMDDMMNEFTILQERINEADQITNKVRNMVFSLDHWMLCRYWTRNVQSMKKSSKLRRKRSWLMRMRNENEMQR